MPPWFGWWLLGCWGIRGGIRGEYGNEIGHNKSVPTPHPDPSG